MPIIMSRKNNCAKAVDVQDIHYGFTHTYIIEYNDGTWEQVKYLDKKTIQEVKEKKDWAPEKKQLATAIETYKKDKNL